MASFREGLAGSLLSAIVSARLAELARTEDPPFVGGTLQRAPYSSPDRGAVSQAARVGEAGVARALEALVVERARLERFGVTAGELDRAKQAALRAAERTFADRETRESASRVDEYVRGFVSGEPALAAELEYALTRHLLEHITPEDLRRLANAWLSENNRWIVATLPAAGGLDGRALAAAVKRAATRPVTAYVDRVPLAALMDAPPQPGAIVSETTQAATGLIEWTLANGARVVLKPTRFKDDQVLFRAVASGGSSLASEDRYLKVVDAAPVVGAGGVGTFGAADLQKMLAGKAATVTPFIGPYIHGLRGSASPTDLETLFQLIHLRFTAPRADPAAVAALAAQERATVPALLASPAVMFSAAVAAATSGDHPRMRPIDLARIEARSLDASIAFYKDRFADASAFTFVFVGAIDPEVMRPLVKTYVASLPSLHRDERARDVGIRQPGGVIEKYVGNSADPGTRTALVFTGAMTFEPARIAAFEAGRVYLGSALLAVLRQRMGATYVVTTTGTLTRFPVPECAVRIEFAADAERRPQLLAAVFRLVTSMRTEPLREQALATLKVGMIRTAEANSQRNEYLLDAVSNAYLYGEDPAAVWTGGDEIQKLTPAAVLEGFSTCVEPSRYVQVVMAPG